jgi:hypothetical protein
MVSSTPITQPTQDRRRQVRVTFSPVRRPRLRLEGGTYEVLDASLDGLRVRHADPARPRLGDRLEGHLEWPGLEGPVGIAGYVVRVESSEFALRCEQGQLPIAHILAEAARRRDAQDPGH